MLADFQNSFTRILQEICNKIRATMPVHHPLDVSLHYLVKCKKTKFVKLYCI